MSDAIEEISAVSQKKDAFDLEGVYVPPLEVRFLPQAQKMEGIANINRLDASKRPQLNRPIAAFLIKNAERRDQMSADALKLWETCSKLTQKTEETLFEKNDEIEKNMQDTLSKQKSWEFTENIGSVLAAIMSIGTGVAALEAAPVVGGLSIGVGLVNLLGGNSLSPFSSILKKWGFSPWNNSAYTPVITAASLAAVVASIYGNPANIIQAENLKKAMSAADFLTTGIQFGSKTMGQLEKHKLTGQKKEVDHLEYLLKEQKNEIDQKNQDLAQNTQSTFKDLKRLTRISAMTQESLKQIIGNTVSENAV